jgi:hypothetical protein
MPLAFASSTFGHHDEVGRQLRAVGEPDRAHAAVAYDRRGLRRHRELEPALLERAPEQLAGRRVELPLHERRVQVHDRHVHAALLQAVCGLEPEQPAADHDGSPRRARRRDHAIDVREVAIRDDAGQIVAGHGQHDRPRPRREYQPVVRRLDAALRDHAAPRAVDAHDLVAGVERDAVLGVPLWRVQHDVGYRLLGREHGREQNPVVVAVRLAAEHGDLVEIGRELQELLDGAHAGHAVADEHESSLPRLAEFRHHREDPPLRRRSRPRARASRYP